MKTRFQLRREAGHGGAVPGGWRMAWYEPPRRVGIYYPAPLHWILRGLRDFSYRLRVALRAPRIERAQAFEMNRVHRDRQRLADEYARGYMCGWRECYDACLDAVEEEISRAGEVWDTCELLTDTPRPQRKN
ncbi:MAG: hypothetical protein WBQ34_07900 [Candidatus Acidiferrales bacterium]